MPELPEVETVARTLAPQVCGHAIVRVEVFNRSTWQGAIRFEDVGPARPVVCGTGRRGKLLLLFFRSAGEGEKACLPASGEEGVLVPGASTLWPVMYTASGMVQGAEFFPAGAACPERLAGLAFHLRMTGRVFVFEEGRKPGPHTRAVFVLDDGRQIFFDDARKFGRVRAVSGPELPSWKFWSEMGPEPLEMSVEDFSSRFSSSRSIKSLLLDQTVVAGVGNIYADESLFRAKIRPDSPGRNISRTRLERLHTCLKEVLLESIRDCGSSIRDYRTASGDVGAFQNRFQVYGRAGDLCSRCGCTLRSTRIAGRTTVYCPRCQKG